MNFANNLNMMTGWKTWAAAAGLLLLGIVEIANGNLEGGLERIVLGLGLVGLGHKIEKKAV
ncbi:hypothetical protein Despr_2448 [Desulfobulbus propionicus DSM 2032]|uniref:Uncharacterized protein n=1 Tax=Desulfobulbus propionicus (strain ATCC 33891 / DSM 2032 / VKM B-1956 / 1pr3) TaxID=577650 RepID=A0A7U3YNE5_DESPD|nr:hypothetical protein [Desulfobulbus propionicus]ADW18587.1 hypothetical protein Despr_2448 [Desulfobulbus propionicus DSM 2032]